MLWHILGQLVFGFVVGAIAKFVMPGKDPGGCFVTALLGLAGAALFSWITRTMGWDLQWHWIGAIIGTLLILILYRMIFGEKS